MIKSSDFHNPRFLENWKTQTAKFQKDSKGFGKDSNVVVKNNNVNILKYYTILKEWCS